MVGGVWQVDLPVLQRGVRGNGEGRAWEKQVYRGGGAAVRGVLQGAQWRMGAPQGGSAEDAAAGLRHPRSRPSLAPRGPPAPGPRPRCCRQSRLRQCCSVTHTAFFLCSFFSMRGA